MEKTIIGMQEEQNLLEAWKKYVEAVRACDEKEAEVYADDIPMPLSRWKGTSFEEHLQNISAEAKKQKEREQVMEPWRKAVRVAKAELDKAKEEYTKLSIEIRTDLSKKARWDYFIAREQYEKAEFRFRTASKLGIDRIVEEKEPWQRANAVIAIEKALAAYIEAKIKCELLETGEA